MESQFDRLGNAYEVFSLGSFRTFLEIPSVFRYLQNLQGKSVLDFGCGTGVYSRLLKQAGAARVSGFDVSRGMLQCARDIEEKEPLGIKYVSELTDDLTGQFDVVLAVYVMPYAVTPDDLDNMCAHMARLLKPGGQLLTLPLHPESATARDYYSRYGFSIYPRDSDGRHDGDIYILDIAGEDDLISAVWWSLETLQKSLSRAGFGPVTVHPPLISEEGLKEIEAEFWRPYLASPHAAILDTRLTQ